MIYLFIFQLPDVKNEVGICKMCDQPKIITDISNFNRHVRNCNGDKNKNPDEIHCADCGRVFQTEDQQSKHRCRKVSIASNESADSTFDTSDSSSLFRTPKQPEKQQRRKVSQEANGNESRTSNADTNAAASAGTRPSGIFSSQCDEETAEVPDPSLGESGFLDDIDLDISNMEIGDGELDNNDSHLTEVHFKRDSKYPAPFTFNGAYGNIVDSSRIPDVRAGSILVKVNAKDIRGMTGEEIELELKNAAKEGHLMFLTLLCHDLEDGMLDPDQMVRISYSIDH